MYDSWRQGLVIFYFAVWRVFQYVLRNEGESWMKLSAIKFEGNMAHKTKRMGTFTWLDNLITFLYYYSSFSG